MNCKQISIVIDLFKLNVLNSWLESKKSPAQTTSFTSRARAGKYKGHDICKKEEKQIFNSVNVNV